MMDEIFNYLETNLGLDQEMAKMILGEYENMMTENIAKLDAAVAANDANQVRVVGHTIKGSSANVGVEAVRAPAYILEKAGAAGDMSVVPGAVAEVKQAFAAFQAAFAQS